MAVVSSAPGGRLVSPALNARARSDLPLSRGPALVPATSRAGVRPGGVESGPRTVSPAALSEVVDAVSVRCTAAYVIGACRTSESEMMRQVQGRDDPVVPAREAGNTVVLDTPLGVYANGRADRDRGQGLHRLDVRGRAPLVVLDVEIDPSDVEKQAFAALARKKPSLDNGVENEVLRDRVRQGRQLGGRAPCGTPSSSAAGPNGNTCFGTAGVATAATVLSDRRVELSANSRLTVSRLASVRVRGGRRGRPTRSAGRRQRQSQRRDDWRGASSDCRGVRAPLAPEKVEPQKVESRQQRSLPYTGRGDACVALAYRGAHVCQAPH